jgi:hypothetical protein
MFLILPPAYEPSVTLVAATAPSSCPLSAEEASTHDMVKGLRCVALQTKLQSKHIQDTQII